MMVLNYPCYYPELCRNPRLVKKPCHTCRMYAQGKLIPEHPVPAVWKHPSFTVDFHFYVQRGYVNAMMEDMIERAKDATSID